MCLPCLSVMTDPSDGARPHSQSSDGSLTPSCVQRMPGLARCIFCLYMSTYFRHVSLIRVFICMHACMQDRRQRYTCMAQGHRTGITAATYLHRVHNRSANMSVHMQVRILRKQHCCAHAEALICMDAHLHVHWGICTVITTILAGRKLPHMQRRGKTAWPLGALHDEACIVRGLGSRPLLAPASMQASQY